jgi:hypothetical protein
MEEVFPILAGVALGLVTHLVRSLQLKAVLVCLFGTAFGACASQVVAASVMTAFLAKIWVRRQTRRVAR